MRKVCAIVFWVSAAGFIILFGYIRMNGATWDRVDLAVGLGMISGASGGIWLALKAKVWWKKRKAV
jgi:hypothetical protein